MPDKAQSSVQQHQEENQHKPAKEVCYWNGLLRKALFIFRHKRVDFLVDEGRVKKKTQIKNKQKKG